MLENNLLYYLGFSHFLGIGPTRFSALLKHFRTVEKAYKATKQELTEVIQESWAEKFVEFRAGFDAVEKMKEIEGKGITPLCLEDKRYPSQLKNIPDPPLCLYVKGDLNKFDFDQDFFFAIVGTRKPTPYGEEMTKKFGRELSSCGMVIVSGLAYGIDALAHWSALQTNQRTIAFLGCGVDVIYPMGNYKLYHEIVKKGLVISEFPPGQTVRPGLFIARNRLISGLSRGVMVIEGAIDSGSLITARYAANQGKEVFAPPSALTSQMSEAPNLLLKQGAKLVTNVSDILDEFNLQVTPQRKKQIVLDLNEEEKAIFELLTVSPKQADEIMLEKNIPIEKALNLLSVLEIKGAIVKNSEGKYQVKEI